MIECDTTIIRILGIPPYAFFATVGIVCASSLFMFLCLKYNYDIPKYTRIFFFSGIGLLIGAKFFGFLTGLYGALANGEPITLDTFIKTGIVYYGGLIGFIISFLLLCKRKFGKINYGAVDVAVVCIPLFLFCGRLGCFFAGCCYGIENHSALSVLYTSRIMDGEIITASRLPIQLIEAVLSIVMFAVLMMLLFKQKIRGRLLFVYLFMYAATRFVLEFFRGDFARGVWGGVSFSQVVSVVVIIGCLIITIKSFKKKEIDYGVIAGS